MSSSYRGKTIVDTYVKPTMPVVSYRTPYTGIEAHHLGKFTTRFSKSVSNFFLALENGVPFNHALALVTSSVDGKIVVGHSLWQDFYVRFFLNNNSAEDRFVAEFIIV
jgi:RNA exonuclease 4